MYVSSTKSLSETRPGRETSTTLPEASQATPSQEVQQSEDTVQESNSFEGSSVILCLKASNASLSTGWHALEGANLEKMKKNRSEKVLVCHEISIDSFESVEVRGSRISCYFTSDV